MIFRAWVASSREHEDHSRGAAAARGQPYIWRLAPNFGGWECMIN